jgi:hypothetical protein
VEQLSKGAGGLEVIFTGWFSANLHWILQWTSLLNLWSLRSLPCLHPLHFFKCIMTFAQNYCLALVGVCHIK